MSLTAVAFLLRSVMDDGSVPPLADNPDWGIPRDSIVFHHLTSKTRRSPDQRHNAYDRCARLYGSLHTWMAMLDADEYLEMTGGGSTIGGRKEKETLSSFLQDFEGSPDVGAVAVNQVIHTSSRLVTRPVSTRRSFTTCIQDQDDDHHGGGHNARTRRIVRTDRYVKAVGPSGTFVQLRNDSVTVGEDWDEVEGTTRSPVTRGRIAVHHYAVGSWQQFQDKVRRGNGLGGRTGQWFWDDVENLPSRRCDEMAKYEP
ncbi:hypothetical protein HKX48_005280 [Thoreauomyces humboldtii]|nr:hypothetical protein HKX48_005280 [Thoreauomyces humboldtii]